MASRLPDSWLEELRSRVNIVDIVAETVPLKQKGRRYWGCCPFHSEKTPSFSVDMDSQMYYCFGCHKGGTVVGFVMDIERMEFMEAVEYLADRAHMKLPDRRENPLQDDQNQRVRESIFEANRQAARFYYDLLWTGEGAQALKYLYARGMNDSDIRRFGLGVSPAGGDSLYRALKDAGFTDDTLTRAWLIGNKDGRVYDMFRDRVMFPILSAQGKVLGFGGRIMGDGQPKYLNTSDTPVFNKRNGLYALNFVKKERAAGRLVLVEGYMDTLSLRKHGVEGVVATLGTALTEEQARLMKRYAPEVWISYDGDPPGQKAALRALDILDAQGVRAKVLAYPAGMDPDDFIRARGREGWEALPKIDPVEYRMIRARDGLDIAVQEDRTEYTIRCCEILKRVTSAVEMENHIRRLSHETGYDRNVLMRQIGESALKTEPTRVSTRVREEKKRDVDYEKARKELIALFHRGLIPAELLHESDFETESEKRVVRYLLKGVPPKTFFEELPEEDRAFALEALNFEPLPENRDTAMDMAEQCVACIRKERINRQISELIEKAKYAEDSDRELINEQIQKLIQQL